MTQLITASAHQNSYGKLPILGTLQRTCACGQHTASSGGECEECKRKRKGILLRSAVTNSPTDEVPPIIHEVLRSSGRPMDPATRAFMEPRFGHNFSRVRLHTDEKAAQSAGTVNALAYTVGRNIVLGIGQYAPHTSRGRQLLAHELSHVIQQKGNTVRARLAIGSPKDKYEQEADMMGRAALSRQGNLRSETQSDGLFDKPHSMRFHLSPSPPRIQRLVAESEFFVKDVFIQIDYNNRQVADVDIRQLLRTLNQLPQHHLERIPAIMIGNRPERGGGSAHSDMPGGPYIRLSRNVFGYSYNRGAFNETLLHEVGHIVDWAFGCMKQMAQENPAGYRALLDDPHRGRTHGPSEHFADAYADYYLGRRMSDERRNALLRSRAYLY